MEENKRKRLVSLPKSENERIPVSAYTWLQTDEKTVCAELHLHRRVQVRILPHLEAEHLTPPLRAQKGRTVTPPGLPSPQISALRRLTRPRVGAAPAHEKRHIRAERHRHVHPRFPPRKGGWVREGCPQNPPAEAEPCFVSFWPGTNHTGPRHSKDPQDMVC